MTKAEQKLQSVKEIVKDMWEKINEDGGYYVKDLNCEVEELASMLDLDTEFDAKEIQLLRKSGFTINRDKDIATKKYRNTSVRAAKFGYSQYFVRFGKDAYDYLEDETDDIQDIVKSNSYFFQDLYKSYKEELLRDKGE